MKHPKFSPRLWDSSALTPDSIISAWTVALGTPAPIGLGMVIAMAWKANEDNSIHTTNWRRMRWTDGYLSILTRDLVKGLPWTQPPSVHALGLGRCLSFEETVLIPHPEFPGSIDGRTPGGCTYDSP